MLFILSKITNKLTYYELLILKGTLIKKILFILISVFLGTSAVLGFTELYLQMSEYKKDYRYEGNLDYALVINEQFCTWNESLYSHPYLAFVHHKNKKCSLNLINSDGFPSPEFPKEANKEFFDILITGGSVAYQLVAGLKSDLNGTLFTSLNKNYKDKSGRVVRVFSTAIGAWKQPQQLISYLLYGSRFDAVISIEGANELSHFDSRRKETEPFGIYWGVNIPQDVEISEPLKWIRNLKSMEKKYPLVRASSLFDVYKKTYMKMLNKEYTEKFSNSWSNEMFKRQKNISREEFVVEYLEKLEKYKLLTKDNVSELFVFIQPILEQKKYKIGSERNTPLENNKYKSYEVLAKKLNQKPISYIYNLMDSFDNIKREIYSDNVHYKFITDESGLTGHEIITQKIMDVIKDKLKLQRVEQ